MLFVRLLLVFGESLPGTDIVKLLHQNQELDVENQTNSNRNSTELKASSTIRICDKKVKIELLSYHQVKEQLQNVNTRFWSKLRGIVFLRDPSESLLDTEFIITKLKELNYTAKYNYSFSLFENGKKSAEEFCSENSIHFHSFNYSKITNDNRDLIYDAFESLVTEINNKHKGTPQRSRRRSSHAPKFNNEISQNIEPLDLSKSENSSTRSSIPSATSEQVAQILADPNGNKKKTRRKSFLTNLKSAGKKKKKRRESLLESGDSDSDMSDCDDSGYSSGNGNCIEDMDGFFTIEKLLDHMIYSPSSSREKIIESFLICLPSFLPEISFARQIMIRWDTNLKDPKALPILRNRIIGILRIWFEIAKDIGFSSDCTALLDKFLNNVIFKSSDLIGIKELQNIWNIKKQSNPKIIPSTSTTIEPPQLLSPRPPRSHESIESSNVTTSNSLSISKTYSPLEVASQLTLIEYNRYQRIQSK